MKKEAIGILVLLFVGIFAAGFSLAAPSENNLNFNCWNFYGGNVSQMQEDQKSIQQAIQANDYDSWKNLMEQQISQMQSQLTQDNFNKLVGMQNKSYEMNNSKRMNPNFQNQQPAKKGFFWRLFHRS
jgi:predicted PurR-regulated permease PerM